MNVHSFPRLVIEKIYPQVDGGDYPVKRLVLDRLVVDCCIFKDGHELISARIGYLAPGGQVRHAELDYEFDADRWYGQFLLTAVGNWEMWIEAWPDPFGTWRRDLEKRMTAGQDVRAEFLEGAYLIRRRADLCTADEAEPLQNAARVLSDANVGVETRARVAFSQTLKELMYGPLDASDVSMSRRYPIRVDRKAAGFSAWYELFPRSESPAPGQHGTFSDTERRLPELAAMGFEVLYFPPIHPIGVAHRKGRNNSPTSEPGDVGSPWAIGSAEGGHTAVHPELGTLDDFRHLVATAADFGMEIALDFALQCSPDHPWVKAHPEWFFVRQDGSIRYAENPPKKYEDIYPLNFWGDPRGELWEEARDVLLFWIEAGVKIFRVDNPHTKPFAFWQWCIAEVQARHPDAIFLSESFTRPNRMNNLAKLGFSQSYTYFTWKNGKQELEAYMKEITTPPVSDYYRPNFFANTPDILHEYLQHGGPPAFRIRLLLAATLSPTYGIYSGFELCEGEAVKPGSEEYIDSEKYELKWRDYSSQASLKREIARINAIRQAEPALQVLTNVAFLSTSSEDITAYLKFAPTEGASHLLVVVNVNPHEARDAVLEVPIERLGIGPDEAYVVRDLLTHTEYTWRGSRNYVKLSPLDQVGHVFELVRK